MPCAVGDDDDGAAVLLSVDRNEVFATTMLELAVLDVCGDDTGVEAEEMAEIAELAEVTMLGFGDTDVCKDDVGAGVATEVMAETTELTDAAMLDASGVSDIVPCVDGAAAGFDGDGTGKDAGPEAAEDCGGTMMPVSADVGPGTTLETTSVGTGIETDPDTTGGGTGMTPVSDGARIELGTP